MTQENLNIDEGIRDERRCFPRLEASVEVQYQILKKAPLVRPAEKELSASKNISAGGICLIVYEEIGVGSILALTINLPDVMSPIKATGRVVWSEYFTVGSDGRDRYDIGVEFIDISDADQGKIARYVFRLIK